MRARSWLHHFAFGVSGTLALVGAGPVACTAKSPEPVAEHQDAAKPAKANQDWEAQYKRLRKEIKEGEALNDPELARLSAGLRSVVEHAKDPHLRANACILAASLHDARKEYAPALSYYRQAIALVPQEPSGYALSALALVKLKRFDQAVDMQQEVVRRDPDDLQAWLLLGELNVLAKRPQDAAKAYAAYETRRSGLMEGLTRKDKAGGYALNAQERAQCVWALAAAPDAGTSLALVYALQSDPDAAVRSALVAVMQEQRFAGYLRPLREWKPQESDPKIVLQIEAALKAISKDPVKTRPEPGDIADPAKASAVVDPQSKDAKSDRSAK